MDPRSGTSRSASRWLPRARGDGPDLGHAEHLLAVKDSLNQQKGAKGPEDWRPPDEGYWCAYATHWEAIKERWELTMTEAEASAVAEMKGTCP